MLPLFLYIPAIIIIWGAVFCWAYRTGAEDGDLRLPVSLIWANLAAITVNVLLIVAWGLA